MRLVGALRQSTILTVVRWRARSERLSRRRWLLAGLIGTLVLLSVGPLWDAWAVNSAGRLVNRAVTTGKDDGNLGRAMEMMESAAEHGPFTAAHEAPIWRTYGAAASLIPSDRAFELLLRSRNAGRLDRVGELWLAEVAAALGNWEEAEEAYRRVDAGNLLIYRGDNALEAGDKELAKHQYLLAKASLDAVVERETARELLLDRTGREMSTTAQFLEIAGDRVTSLYRIGRGLLSAGGTAEATEVLEQAIEAARTSSPGTVMEQSIVLSLALALARGLPGDGGSDNAASAAGATDAAQPASVNEYSYRAALTRIRGLVDEGVAIGRTASACVQAGRVLLHIGDSDDGVQFLRQAIELDPQCKEAYLVLGGWFESNRMLLYARELFAEAVRAVPADTDLAVAHAIAAYLSLPPQESLPILENAAKSTTRDPYLFMYLGDCYSDLHRPVSALFAYQEGLRRSPEAEPLLERVAMNPPRKGAIP